MALTRSPVAPFCDYPGRWLANESRVSAAGRFAQASFSTLSNFAVRVTPLEGAVSGFAFVIGNGYDIG